jgi:hypothetical protein
MDVYIQRTDSYRNEAVFIKYPSDGTRDRIRNDEEETALATIYTGLSLTKKLT